jgi:hypothetical protein
MDGHAAVDQDMDDFVYLKPGELVTHEDNVHGMLRWKEPGRLHSNLDDDYYYSDSPYYNEPERRRRQRFKGCECTVRPWRSGFPLATEKKSEVLFGTCQCCIERLVGPRPLYRSAMPWIKARSRVFRKLYMEDVKNMNTFQEWLRMEKIKTSRLMKKQKLL